MYFSLSTAAALLPVLAAAVAPPNYPGMSIVWSDSFNGAAGDPVDVSKWNVITNSNVNNELEVYSTSSSNLQLSGGGTVQFVPWQSASGAWTSGRIESIGTWTPNAGKVMQVEATLRTTGDAANGAGMWPAFWMLGDSMRHGTPWPQCSEIDIFEKIGNIPTVYGTAHCPSCNQPIGRQGSVQASNDWHTYGVKIDRTANDWTQESITWMVDGQSYFTLTGATIGDVNQWTSMAHSPLYMILNLAVGGDWPGPPNSATIDGYGNMLEVEYAAVYTT